MSSRVSLRVYDGEGMLPDIVRLIETQLRCVTTLTQRTLQHLYLPLLSAPMAYMDDAEKGTVPVGVIVNKLDRHLRGARMYRGYIAMLSVDPEWRGHGIDAMVQRGAQEIVLETEVDNAAALRLYERLGFLREKRLFRFYLNGKDSFRLVLPVPAQRPQPAVIPPPRRLIPSDTIL